MTERLDDQTRADSRLAGVRVLGAINGIELFGHERSNIEVFRTLRALGAQVRVGVHPIEDNHVRDELERSGIETFPIPFGPQWSIQWVKRHPSLVFTNFWKVWTSSRAFSKEVRSFDPTHFHIGSPLVYSYLALALKRHSQPLVYRMGDCPPPESARFNRNIWKLAMRRTNRLVCISRFVADRAGAGGRHADTVIYNLAPTFHSDRAVPGPHKPGESLTRLLYVGSISEDKGVGILIDALAILRKRHPNLVVELLGGSRYDAAERAKMKGRAEAHEIGHAVRFLGHLNDPTPFYHRADLHVHPAIVEEALGNVVMEAKCSGTPSIVFPSGGLPEMIRHETDGFICREKSVSALAEAMDWCLADHERLIRMGLAARADYESRFGPARFRNQWAAVYMGRETAT